MKVAPRVQFHQDRHGLVCTITDPVAKSFENRTLIFSGLTDGEAGSQCASAEVFLHRSISANRRNSLVIHYPAAWSGEVEAKFCSPRPAVWLATRDSLIPRLVQEVRFPSRSTLFRTNAVIALVHSVCEVESLRVAQL